MSSPRLADFGHFVSPQSSSQPCARYGAMRDLYENLLSLRLGSLAAARAFVEDNLERARGLPCDFPTSPSELMSWMQQHTENVSTAYSHYLQARKLGGRRRYFSCRSHALHFLRAVAPTKLVDGAWLYGLLPHWREAGLHALVRTYLEELGDGVASLNHVLLYRQLLVSHGCDDLTGLDDKYYAQGALQLALGHLAAQYIPEVIGFNLGYEQLPLHLLITAYELTEFGIDSYYFKLHVTIDNAATGHAQKAVNAVTDNLPVLGDADEFYRRVAAGYRLNELGTGSTAIIESFDLENEMLQMLERKRVFAQNMHSDYCRIEGRTVNEWLGDGNSIGLFMEALQKYGWIRRHADPQQSRFWQLLQGQKAAMFGVFTEYEQQLLYDWIAGDWLSDSETEQPHLLAAKRRRASFRQIAGGKSFSNPAHESRVDPAAYVSQDIDAESDALDEELAGIGTARKEQCLIGLAAPGLHWSPAGLKATRILSRLIQ